MPPNSKNVKAFIGRYSFQQKSFETPQQLSIKKISSGDISLGEYVDVYQSKKDISDSNPISGILLKRENNMITILTDKNTLISIYKPIQIHTEGDGECVFEVMTNIKNENHNFLSIISSLPKVMWKPSYIAILNQRSGSSPRRFLNQIYIASKISESNIYRLEDF